MTIFSVEVLISSPGWNLPSSCLVDGTVLGW